MFSVCQTTILLILLTVGVNNSKRGHNKCCITDHKGQQKQSNETISKNIEHLFCLPDLELCHDTNAASIDISINCNSCPTENENHVLNKQCTGSVKWKLWAYSISCLECTVKSNKRPSTLQTPDLTTTTSPNSGSTPYLSPNCRAEVTVLAVVLVIVIIASAVVISLLLWRMRKLAETYRCCERGCLSFCRIHNSDNDSRRTSAPQLENPEQFYSTARRFDSNEHEYTGLQERAGTSQTLPSPLQRDYSLARNIPEEVTNTDNEYSLAKVIRAESENQGKGSVVHNLVKHPNTILGGATPTYFILEKESDSTPACKESETNQEYFILEKDSGPHSDED